MANNNLIFPIKFDFESGLQKAERDAERSLRELQAKLNRKPLSISLTTDREGFQTFSRQFSNSIDGIQRRLNLLQKNWNAMSFDRKFDENGNLSKAGQAMLERFGRLTTVLSTMGQRLGEVNRQLAQSEAETTRLITAEYDKRKKQIELQIKEKERQAAAEERVRQAQLKGVNVGYIDLQKQTEAVRNLRLQYEAILPMLNAMAQKRVDIKVRIDKQFETDVNRINAEIARLRQSNLQLGAKGDANAIKANLAAIHQLEAELQRINQQKLNIFNSDKIHGDISRLRTEIASTFGELQAAERKLAADNSLNAALDAQGKKVLTLHTQIQNLDKQVAQLNAQGNMYKADGSFTSQAAALLQQRISLTKQLEQAAVTGQQAQIRLEQQLREEKRRTDQEAKNAAREAERQAKAEKEARKQAIEAANAENKARQAAYNARRKQGIETQRILQQEAKSIADITAQLQIQQQRLNTANVGSAKFNKIAEEVKRLTEDLDKANQKMRELTGQTVSGANRQSAAINQANSAFNSQGTYLSRLIQRMAVYASISQMGNFLTKIREVTAEFELQRVSLGAIIQDQNRADALFTQVKGLALESPFKLLDLTKYTKQLAAYQIETDDLFDTMKRLADVSAGLGVSMDRLILAYGQTKATGYLRASEIRQFTEAGLPIVDQLAKKLSAANGEMVRAADVMDMVSKRQMPFEMVADVFEDMTQKGGLFFDMQKKQGETLYGMWQKLGDAASIMFNDIGTSDLVNQTMKSTIEVLRQLMLNWREVGAAMTPIAIMIGAIVLKMKAAKLATKATSAANIAYVNTLKQKVIALQSELVATARTTPLQRMQARASIAQAKAQIVAATSTNVFSKALHGLKAAFLSNPWGIVITAITSIIAYFWQAKDAAEELSDSLSEIDEKYNNISRNNAENLTKLANEAVNAAGGTKKQKEALEELSRTYGEMIPQELLTIENLRNMRGEYGSLIALVDEYNVKRKYEEREASIEQSGKTAISEAEENARDWLNAAGIGNSDPLQDKIIQEIKDKVNEGIDAIEATDQVIDKYSNQLSQLWSGLNQINIFHWEKMADAWESGFNPREIYELGQAIAANNQAMEENDAAMQAEVDGLNKYTQYVDRAKKAVDAVTDNPIALHLMLEYDLPDDSEIASQIENLMSGKIESFVANQVKYDEIGNQIAALTDKIVALKQSKDELGAAFPIADEKALANAERQRQLLFDQQAGLIVMQHNVKEFDWSNLAPSEQVSQMTDMRIKYIQKQVENMFTEAGMQIPKDWAKNVYGQWVANFDVLLKLAANDEKLKARLIDIKSLWENLAPTDTMTQVAQKHVRSISDETNMSASTTEKALKKAGESWEEYAKRVKESVRDVILANIAALRGEIRDLERETVGMPQDTWIIPAVNDLRDKRKELKEYEQDLAGMNKVVTWADSHVYKENKKAGAGRTGRTSHSGGSKQDPRLQNLKEEISLVQKLYKEYEQLEKNEGKNKAVADMQKMAGATIDMFKNKYGFDLPTDAKDLTSALEILYNKMAALPKKVFPSLDKDLKELRWTIENVKIDDSQKKIEEQIKELADKISRTKTAKEFYDKVLGMTGDLELAATVSIAVYGEDGKALKQQIIDNIQATLGKTKDGMDIDFTAAIRADKSIDYNELVRVADAQLKLGNISEDTYKKVLKMRDDDRKDLAKTVEGWLKATEKAKTYSDKLLDLTRTTNNEIAEINRQKSYSQARIDTLLGKGTLTAEEQAELTNLQNFLTEAETLIQRFKDKQAKEETSLAYEAFKNSPMYVQLFDDLGSASTTMLTAMRDRLVTLKDEWKNLDPTQLKEMQQRLREIDEQLTSRNPFKALIASIKKYRNLRTKGDSLGSKSSAEADEKLLKATMARVEAEAKYNKLLHDDKATQEQITEAKQEFDTAQSQEKDAQKAKEVWQDVKITMGSATDTILGGLSTVGDIANSVADIMEAVGADEEDVAYWRTIGDSIGQITAGVQDMVQSLMKGDLMGVITGAVTAIPKMFVGFVNLFSANKVRKANKEIKKQEEILEQLEYTYERLEAAADKLFGTDYINNYNKQMEALEAEQSAYLKQAEAERSKGKKADKKRIKEYENNARDTANKILELEDEIMNRMTGTERKDLAKEWAQSWIEAKVAFENTTEAIKSKYRDMIKSMIIEGAAARIIDSILAPMWERADSMLKEGRIDDAIDYVISNMGTVIDSTDRAMNTFWEGMRAKGYDIDNTLRDNETKAASATGIKRDYATASEESINGLAAAVNTQNWYISYVPTIAADTHALRTFIESGYLIDSANASTMIDLQQQALGNLQGIERHTAETVTECKRIAEYCKSQADYLSKVVTNKNGASAYGVQVFMR